MSPSRRTFLREVSAAAALGILGRVPGRRLLTAPLGELLPEPDEALLRQLALTAVDAAHAAGATFADVRVAAGQLVMFGCSADWSGGQAQHLEMSAPQLSVLAEYGIRAIVDGAWGFAGGAELTPEAVSRTAQQAVARARTNRPRRPRTLELAPVPPAAKGGWATPIVRDPFQVPVGEQADVAFAALAEAGRVHGVHQASVGLAWDRILRVFASSEGALIVQRIAIAEPSATAVVNPTAQSPGGSELVEALRAGAYGYEALTGVDLKAELRQAAERAVAASRRPPPRTVEVGRYDLVLGAPAVASLLTETISEAVNLERVLGYRANWAGTSFAAPPAEILGQYRVGSPLLTVRADRTRPHGAMTVGWDDEGVPAGAHTLVRDGLIVDYLTNRQTAMELAPYYRAKGEPVQSRGCASGVGQLAPRVVLPNLALQPGKDALTAEDLIRDTKRGVYIEAFEDGRSDQQVLNSQFSIRDGLAREIRNGKLGARLRDIAIQFVTPEFWRSMDAIGGASSMVDTIQIAGATIESVIQLPFATATAPPARVRKVNVLNIGQTS